MWEAAAVGVASHLIIGLPWTMAFAYGFTLAAVSPAVLVPPMLILHKTEYGTAKGIPLTMIAASSFDDIVAITLYGVFITSAMSSAPRPVTDSQEEQESMGLKIGMNFVQIITGLVIGIALGYSMYFIRHTSNFVKFLVCIFVVIAVPVASELTTFHESKYVCLVFFGWAAFRVWGHEKPDKELDSLWTILTPFLYATVGASIKFSEISGSMIGNAVAIILIGITLRWIGTFLACMERKFNNKERAFIAFGWIPKATV